MTCCGAVPMTPVSCYTVFFGQWFPSFWARSLCSWRYVLAPWLFEPRPSRRGSAPMRSAKTCLPCHLTAAAARPETRSRRTLTPSCHRPQGPCRCLRSQCGAEIGNIRASRKMFLQHEITKMPMSRWAKSTKWLKTPPTTHCCPDWLVWSECLN